jgi:hypothetical protein
VPSYIIAAPWMRIRVGAAALGSSSTLRALTQTPAG